MKSLILFVVAVIFRSVHCDVECFRDVFRECMSKHIPLQEFRLCDETKRQIECVYRMADKCDMQFRGDAEDHKIAIQRVCNGGAVQKLFDEEKACYKRAVKDKMCYGPIGEAMRGIESMADFIRANKKVCHLFQPYSNCVEENVEKDCGSASRVLFKSLYDPLRGMSNSLCHQLVLLEDEDDKPYSLGWLNVYAFVAKMFAFA
ncbi:hypothetical protein AVEN_122419-1 [Araneus ventricosus]|uniref:DUF19 domain-containing protein n=1 Tax=Araneus ventricosus TaxID=182803 RepID=A0A4Y2K277_ARAVE|nr:hypothetical protein AVEN_122419-1 [Araneus ventricosus]